MEIKGQMILGSNYSFLVTLDHEGVQLDAVYKPMKGEVPLWDFPYDSLADREVAAYIISEALGWNLVPPTVIRRKAPFGQGSLQVFIPHDPQQNYFSFGKDLHKKLRPTVLLDLVINNADRKGSHIILDEYGGIKLIDHGLCFHTEPKLRTVIWDFSGQPIPANLLEALDLLRGKILSKSNFYTDLKKYLKEAEIHAIAHRIQEIMDHPVYPAPDPNRRPFPWPLV